jgi:hypothetical protein
MYTVRIRSVLFPMPMPMPSFLPILPNLNNVPCERAAVNQKTGVR